MRTGDKHFDCVVKNIKSSLNKFGNYIKLVER